MASLHSRSSPPIQKEGPSPLDSLPTLPSYDLTIPYRFSPRPYQLPILQALDRGIKRAVQVWHRRAGKDKTDWNWTIRQSQARVGTYFYLFPTYAQAKKVIWDGVGKDGFPFLSHVPKELIKSKNETELRVELLNNSAIQLIGTDKIDSIMGTNPVGCVFAEYSLQDPRAWDYVRPILRENDGWAIFNFLPRGRNHAWDIHQVALANPDTWFDEILPCTATGSEHYAAEERRDGMSEEMIQQEYYCSFEGVNVGSVFGRAMQEAEREGRICSVPWQPEFPVDTWWDIGTGDPTAIWFTQNIGREVHVVDYYENSGAGVGIDFYARHLQTLPYVWGTHNGPHDLEAHQFAANGKSTREVAAALGLRFVITDKLDKQSQINSGRSFLKRCWFDRAKTERGRDALVSYHYKWQEERKSFSDDPYHDWSSNGADAYMQLAVGHKFAEIKKKPVIEIIGAYDKDAMSQQWMGA